MCVLFLWTGLNFPRFLLLFTMTIAPVNKNEYFEWHQWSWLPKTLNKIYCTNFMVFFAMNQGKKCSWSRVVGFKLYRWEDNFFIWAEKRKLNELFWKKKWRVSIVKEKYANKPKAGYPFFSYIWRSFSFWAPVSSRSRKKKKTIKPSSRSPFPFNLRSSISDARQPAKSSSP